MRSDNMNTQTDITNQQTRRTHKRPVFFVMSRKQNTAALFDASCFEHLQEMFRVGIALPDGTVADGIGRSFSAAAFVISAARGGTRIQYYDASHLNKAEATTAQPLQIEDMKQGKIERDYEPEQSYGTAHDFQEHTRFGGTREDY